MGVREGFWTIHFGSPTAAVVPRPRGVRYRGRGQRRWQCRQPGASELDRRWRPVPRGSQLLHGSGPHQNSAAIDRSRAYDGPPPWLHLGPVQGPSGPCGLALWDDIDAQLHLAAGNIGGGIFERSYTTVAWSGHFNISREGAATNHLISVDAPGAERGEQHSAALGSRQLLRLPARTCYRQGRALATWRTPSSKGLA